MIWDGVKSWLFGARADICLAGILLLGTCYLLKPKRELWLVGGIALVGLFSATRFLEFQPQGIHLHDVFHYQTGSKYPKELGYTGIYDAVGAALLELSYEKQIPRTKIPKDVRGLRDKAGTNHPIDDKMIERAKQRFSTERWAQFKSDILSYEKIYSMEWDRIVHDAGYNPTPWWTTMGAAANLFLRSPQDCRKLPLLDIIYLVLTMIVIQRTFGLRAALYAAALASLFPPGRFAPFDYTGASILRTSWIFWLTAGLCAYHTNRMFLCGLSLALATMERIFPGAWAAAALLASSSEAALTKRWKGVGLLVAGGAAGGAFALGASSILLGPGAWYEFSTYISEHTSLLFTNHIGWAKAVGLHPHIQDVAFSRENMFILRRWSEILTSRQDWALFLVIKIAMSGAAIIWAARRRDTAAVGLLGAASVFMASFPAHYYLLGLIGVYASLFQSDESRRDTSHTQRLGGWAIYLAAASTVAISAGETAGWAITSAIVAGAMAYGCGTLLTPKNPVVGGLVASGFWVFALCYPQLSEARGNPKFPAEVKVAAKGITRNYIDETGREIRDTGIMLPPNTKAKIKTETSGNHTLHIRTDHVFRGELELSASNGGIIHVWKIEPLGSIFETIKIPLPPERDYVLTWKGPGKDMGIFSVWTEPSQGWVKPVSVKTGTPRIGP